ncbi:hypothetical protein [Streptoalloteichus hindustanus]|uniref:hypothetical protein n=1 Tax=Streptoalloteichus hindustanus TaxID=2017 RepID=UPI00190E835A|nr:hypothetical protein [Streptoalloteichus hindustanus]
MQARAGDTKLVPVGVTLFGIGLLAVVAIFVLFATGRTELPVWLNVTAGLGLPVGLALGVAGVIRNARRSRR